jgi:AcrR family transcriptional regulator
MPKHSTTLDATAPAELIRDEMSDKIISAAEKIATSAGPEELTVRKILQHLAITNRVFYNRFHNISEVLDIVYKNTIQKIRNTIPTEFDPDKDTHFSEVFERADSEMYKNKRIMKASNN